MHRTVWANCSIMRADAVHRISLPLLMLMTFAAGLTASSGVAATISFGEGDPSSQFSLPTEVNISFENSVVKPKQKLAPKRQVPKPKPPAPKPVPAEEAMLASAGSSMSSLSMSSVSGGASTPAAATGADEYAIPSVDGSYLQVSDWLFIPPRFLDGVFRPPRQVVSS